MDLANKIFLGFTALCVVAFIINILSHYSDTGYKEYNGRISQYEVGTRAYSKRNVPESYSGSSGNSNSSYSSDSGSSYSSSSNYSSGSPSYSSSSTYSSYDSPEDEGNECSYCYGEGFCSRCYGSGYDHKNDTDCSYCYGKGYCKYCDGTGRE